MKRMMNWLETSLAPVANKMNNNVWIQSLKEAMFQVLPMILVGSIVTMLCYVGPYIPGCPDFWSLYNYTMGIVGGMVAFLVPFNYLEHKKLNKLRIAAGITSFSMFAIALHMDTPDAFDFSMFGAGGMFAAILLGIIAGLVFGAFGKFSFFKEDSAIPDFVQQWFNTMIPASILIFGTWILVYLFHVDIFGLVGMIISPLTGLAESLPGFVILIFVANFFLYSMGISTWMLYPIMNPIMLAGITANTAALAAGDVATNIFTSEVVYTFLAIGGAGNTLVLNIMMLKAKSKRLNAVGKASIVPSIFNINEPIVFGSIAWNPMLMVPTWIQGIIAPIITWCWFHFGLATVPGNVFGLGYLPSPVVAWLVSPCVGSLILIAILFAVGFVIYYPFFKVADKMAVEEEAVKAAEKAARKATKEAAKAEAK